MYNSNGFVLVIPVANDWLSMGWEAFTILDQAVIRRTGAVEVSMTLDRMATPPHALVQRFVMRGHVVRYREKEYHSAR